MASSSAVTSLHLAVPMMVLMALLLMDLIVLLLALVPFQMVSFVPPQLVGAPAQLVVVVVVLVGLILMEHRNSEFPDSRPHSRITNSSTF